MELKHEEVETEREDYKPCESVKDVSTSHCLPE